MTLLLQNFLARLAFLPTQLQFLLMILFFFQFFTISTLTLDVSGQAGFPAGGACVVVVVGGAFGCVEGGARVVVVVGGARVVVVVVVGGACVVVVVVVVGAASVWKSQGDPDLLSVKATVMALGDWLVPLTFWHAAMRSVLPVPSKLLA